MIRVTPYVLVLAVCIVFGSCTQEDEEFGDAVAVVNKRIDVREVVHIKRRRPITEQGQNRNESLYYRENGKSRLLQSILSGVQIVTDSGQAVVCGPPNAKINVTWTPKILNKDGVVTMYIDLVAPIEIDKATITIEVYMKDVPGPIFSLNNEETCADVKKQVPGLNCPIQKDLHIKFQTKEMKLSTLPEGSYNIVVKVTNEHGQLFACLKLDLIIVGGI